MNKVWQPNDYSGLNQWIIATNPDSVSVSVIRPSLFQYVCTWDGFLLAFGWEESKSQWRQTGSNINMYLANKKPKIFNLISLYYCICHTFLLPIIRCQRIYSGYLGIKDFIVFFSTPNHYPLIENFPSILMQCIMNFLYWHYELSTLTVRESACSHEEDMTGFEMETDWCVLKTISSPIWIDDNTVLAWRHDHKKLVEFKFGMLVNTLWFHSLSKRLMNTRRALLYWWADHRLNRVLDWMSIA